MLRSILKTLTSHNPNHCALTNFRFVQTQSGSIKPKLTFEDKQSFTVSYFTDSCGLSLKSAIAASKLVEIRNKEKSDSVLELFRSHGFSHNDISNLISKCPRVILVDPVKNLRPRLEFFESLGIARTDLPHTVIKSSKLFNRSLDKGIKPTLDFLKCYVDPNKNVARTVVALRTLVSASLERVLQNVETLRYHNVPKAVIGVMLLRYHGSVTGKADIFKEVVTAVSEMGIDPKLHKFIDVVAAMVLLNKSVWETRKKTFLSLGWTESDFDLAFSLYPVVMFTTEKKVRKMMDFLVNKVGLKASDVARCPAVLQASLEKSVIPRWSVLQLLISKGLLQNVDLIWKFKVSKKVFEDSMVHKFKDEIPELVKAYENQISSGEFIKATSKDA